MVAAHAYLVGGQVKLVDQCRSTLEGPALASWSASWSPGSRWYRGGNYAIRIFNATWSAKGGCYVFSSEQAQTTIYLQRDHVGSHVGRLFGVVARSPRIVCCVGV